MPVLELQAVSKSFQNQLAVDQVSLEVASGETLVILGTSGSGKTTCLKMINRLLEADSGDIYFQGRKSSAIPVVELRRQMGYVIQGVGLFPHYTVAENIALVPQLLAWKKGRIATESKLWMERLQLPLDYMNAYPHQLSGGQQQRVGIARALIAEPSLLLMDEPFGALDPITRAAVRHEFLALDVLKHSSVIMVSHDVEEAIIMGDRICLMDQGKIQQIGKAEELLLKPANAYVKAFFSEKHFQLLSKAISITQLLPFCKQLDFTASEKSLSLSDWLNQSSQPDRQQALLEALHLYRKQYAGVA